MGVKEAHAYTKAEQMEPEPRESECILFFTTEQWERTSTLHAGGSRFNPQHLGKTLVCNPGEPLLGRSGQWSGITHLTSRRRVVAVQVHWQSQSSGIAPR